MAILSNLKPPAGAKRSPMRVGRGVGSGKGKTAGRGQKGQYARVGHSKPASEGGQMPLQRRLPKRGFTNVLAERVASINVGQLEAFDAGTEVTATVLSDRGLVKGRFDSLKIIGNGELTKKLTVRAQAFSATAVRKIQRVGGAIELVPSAKAQRRTSQKAAAGASKKS